MKAHVWVMPKRTVLDPQGQTIQHALSGLGYNAVRDVRQGKFFVLNLDGWSRDEAQKQLEQISRDVLKNIALKLWIEALAAPPRLCCQILRNTPDTELCLAVGMLTC